MFCIAFSERRRRENRKCIPNEVGAAAGNCTRTSSVAGRHSAVKSQPLKLRGPGALLLPAHAISTKNKHLLLSGLRYQPTVSRWFFRCFGAHLLRSPQIGKSGLNHSARFLATCGHSPPVENLGSPAPSCVLCQATSSRRAYASSHSALPFVVKFTFSVVQEQ